MRHLHKAPRLERVGQLLERCRQQSFLVSLRALEVGRPDLPVRADHALFHALEKLARDVALVPAQLVRQLVDLLLLHVVLPLYVGVHSK